jgi:hypothetical protein
MSEDSGAHDLLRRRLQRAIEALPEAQLYQALDYVEFLASKYNRSPGQSERSPVQRFGERFEDSLRMHRVGFRTIRGTMDAVSAVDRFLDDVRRAGRGFVEEVQAETTEVRDALRRADAADHALPPRTGEGEGPR